MPVTAHAVSLRVVHDHDDALVVVVALPGPPAAQPLDLLPPGVDVVDR
jgi:hypothetical protein